ncbi:hypothetical protein [Arthrobacter sp. SLBN-53]|uniref:hypothetical protein n=1 Tax=Arthrobacter sp. SLBN-53 TaxID=2768412 RepID=UPI0011519924|nr:hypothetical protein [Arthrobacter sp. SLBN-53]TQK29356.1 hypothetical protein FBY28_2359 [Arthrobacter sp. SLBN-53]
MSNIPVVIADRIGPLVETLHDAFEHARHRIDNNYPGLCREDQGWLRTHNLRGLTYQRLQDVVLPDHWELSGRHQRNGMINLAYGSGQMALRFVHAFPSVGEPPIAGHNHARRAWYTQRALDELTDPDFMPTQRLLLVWDEISPTADFTLSVIRPLSPGTLRRRVRRDLEIPLPRTLTAFEQTQFDTSDEDEDLYYEIDQDDVDTGTDDDK